MWVGSARDLAIGRAEWNGFIDQINSSDADFLMVAPGANKGQRWLRRNHYRLQVPIRSHLGATINFQAGVIKRAPPAIRKMGLEWLWRIKEEPHLWRRYWNDGRVVMRLFISNILPAAVDARWMRLRGPRDKNEFAVSQIQAANSLTLRISGNATVDQLDKAIPCFRVAVASQKQVVIDLSQTRWLDARFFGLLLMLRKQVSSQGSPLQFTGVNPALRRQFRLNRVEYLLVPQGADSSIAGQIGLKWMSR